MRRTVAETHKPLPSFDNFPPSAFPNVLVGTCLKESISRVLFSVTCANPRCDPAYFFKTGPQGQWTTTGNSRDILGFFTNIWPTDILALQTIRGCVQQNVSDIFSINALSKFKQLLVIHHTGNLATIEAFFC